MALQSSNRGMLIFLLVVLLFVAGFYLGRDGLDFGPELPAMQGTGGETPLHGDFSFDRDIRDTYFRNGVNAVLGFQFDSALSTTPCNSIGLIQMVRTLDLDDPNRLYYYPSLQKKQRATENGWYIDRGEGYDCVFYGMQNNGRFEPYLTPIEASTERSMSDRPYRPENHPYLGIRWQAVTVPVCLDGGTEREGHGYYAWSWTVTRKGAVKDVKDIVANNSLTEDFGDALSKWNDQHPAETTKCSSGETFTVK